MPVDRNHLHNVQENATANAAKQLFSWIDDVLTREYDYRQPYKKIKWEDRRDGGSDARKVSDDVAEYVKREYGSKNWDVTYEQHTGNPRPRSNFDDYGPYTTFYFTSPPRDPRD